MIQASVTAHSCVCYIVVLVVEPFFGVYLLLYYKSAATPDIQWQQHTTAIIYSAIALVLIIHSSATTRTATAAIFKLQLSTGVQPVTAVLQPSEHFPLHHLLCCAVMRNAMQVKAGADFVITQFFYDVSVFLNWKERCRSAGITVPLLPG
jgi:Methylenetetrahydrofolate reductase